MEIEEDIEHQTLKENLESTLESWENFIQEQEKNINDKKNERKKKVLFNERLETTEEENSNNINIIKAERIDQLNRKNKKLLKKNTKLLITKKKDVDESKFFIYLKEI